MIKTTSLYHIVIQKSVNCLITRRWLNSFTCWILFLELLKTIADAIIRTTLSLNCVVAGYENGKKEITLNQSEFVLNLEFQVKTKSEIFNPIVVTGTKTFNAIKAEFPSKTFSQSHLFAPYTDFNNMLRGLAGKY